MVSLSVGMDVMFSIVAWLKHANFPAILSTVKLQQGPPEAAQASQDTHVKHNTWPPAQDSSHS